MHPTEWLRRMGLGSPARRLEWYPPFFSMRIRVLELADDWSRVRILLPLRHQNTNPGGIMFGGCMASLADPIPALACVQRFPDYSVWTRQLKVDFQREGRSEMELRFDFDPDLDARIRMELEQEGRSDPWFKYAFFLPDGTQCAAVENCIAIRRTDFRANSSGALKPGGLQV